MRQPVGSALYRPDWTWSPDAVCMVCAWLGHVTITMDKISPLVQAAASGDLKSLTTLLQCGRDVNGADDEGRSSLYYCAAKGDTTGCELLLKCRANVSAMTQWGSTPLHAAAEAMNPDCVDMLIKNGADVNGQTSSGDTPLHQACYYGHAGTARVLLKHGASINIRNHQGRSPLDEARSRGNTELIALLQDFSSDNTIEKWRKKGYTFIPSIRPKIDNLSATTGLTGDFEIIGNAEVRQEREQLKTRSREMRGPCESLEPDAQTEFGRSGLPVAVQHMSVDTKLGRNGFSHNAGERRSRDCGANVFLLDQNLNESSAQPEPTNRSAAADSTNCPKCGHTFQARGRHIHPSNGSASGDDVITRLRNDYALLSRMFYEVQMDLVKEREDNTRLKKAVKNHNYRCHQGQSPDLLL